MKITLFFIIASIFILTIIFFYLNERQPSTLGIRDGKFPQCPNRPNCVNSQSKEGIHRIDPIVYRRTEDPIPILTKIIRDNFPTARIVKEKENYLHVEFRSQWFRFVDDTEFYYNPSSAAIHVKSTSRVGYYDFDVNRKRIEQIRILFKEASQ